MSTSTTSSLIINLANQTGLDSSKYTIYVLGFSATSLKQLVVSSGTVGTFQTYTNASGNLPAYKLGSEITEISIDNSSPFTDAMKIDGARIYFFVSENTKFPSAPVVPYTGSGANIQNVPNPPQNTVAPYSFSEFTLVDLGYGAVIDLQTVDGFVFPLNLTLSNSLGEIGQPLSAQTTLFNRSTILSAYSSFMTNLGTMAAAYEPLLYAENSGGLVNPGAYLSATDTKNALLHLDSPLNTVFDTALNSLFANSNLSLQGVTYGSINADTYSVNSVGQQTLPSGLTHQALQFKGDTNSIELNVFNPVNLCVLSYSNNGTLTPITGQISDTTLTFASALPGDTALVTGMFVQGAGVNPNSSTITAINTNEEGAIVSVTLDQNYGSPASGQYAFSKVAGMFATSGTMTFANSGVFAWGANYGADETGVVLELQNQLVCALNRGVSELSPTSGTKGWSTEYWGTQTNWYPTGETQNLFSLFMHTGVVAIPPPAPDEMHTYVPIFIRPENPCRAANGALMGQAYGFAYDENAGPVPPAPVGQPEVPSKYDPLPSAATSMTITLGTW